MENFEYFYTKQAVGNLEIDDIGNCYIEAYNDEGLAWYLLVETNLGWTKVFEYGPATPDFQELPKEVICKFQRFEFNKKTIQKTITAFLNDYKRNITQAMEVERSIIFDNCKSLIEYVEKRENF